MAQWINRLWNNVFVNPPPLPLSCEISVALHLAEPGLTAGWQAGWLADELQVNFKILKISCRLNIRVFSLVKQGAASLRHNQCIPAGFFG